MLWVYDQYKCVIFFSAGIDSGRHNLTSNMRQIMTFKVDPRTEKNKNNNDRRPIT